MQINSTKNVCKAPQPNSSLANRMKTAKITRFNLLDTMWRKIKEIKEIPLQKRKFPNHIGFTSMPKIWHNRSNWPIRHSRMWLGDPKAWYIPILKNVSTPSGDSVKTENAYSVWMFLCKDSDRQSTTSSRSHLGNAFTCGSCWDCTPITSRSPSNTQKSITFYHTSIPSPGKWFSTSKNLPPTFERWNPSLPLPSPASFKFDQPFRTKDNQRKFFALHLWLISQFQSQSSTLAKPPIIHSVHQSMTQNHHTLQLSKSIKLAKGGPKANHYRKCSR